MNWRDEQQLFWDWITRPQDLHKSAGQIDELFAPHAHIGRVEALGIYNNAFHQRLIQVASEMYPILYHTLGNEVFAQLWLGYLGEHLPRPGPMRRMSEQLLPYVQAHPQLGALPALPDIIRVETLTLELFDRADEPALTAAQLQALAAEAWPTMRCRPRNDWALLDSRFDLPGYWQQMQAHISKGTEPGSADFGVAPAGPDPAQTHGFLVQRRQFRMQSRPLSPLLRDFLRLLQQSLTFAEICEQLSRQHSEEDIPSLSLALLLEAVGLELLLADAPATADATSRLVRTQ